MPFSSTLELGGGSRPGRGTAVPWHRCSTGREPTRRVRRPIDADHVAEGVEMRIGSRVLAAGALTVAALLMAGCSGGGAGSAAGGDSARGSSGVALNSGGGKPSAQPGGGGGGADQAAASVQL